MRYLVVIPARGGSKGIPHKNIYRIGDKTLLDMAIECVEKVTFDGIIAVSTDDEAIADIASEHRNVVVIDRPADISGDTARTEDALIHAVNYMKENYGDEFDAVITLQVTSPLRKSETVRAVMDEFEASCEKYDSILTLTEDRTDFWVFNDGRYARLFPDAPRRRQERTPIYAENSALYITRTESLIKYKSVLGNNPTAYVIDALEGIDINDTKDIYMVESILKDKEM